MEYLEIAGKAVALMVVLTILFVSAEKVWGIIKRKLATASSKDLSMLKYDMGMILVGAGSIGFVLGLNLDSSFWEILAKLFLAGVSVIMGIRMISEKF